jgi:hypothetical protein
MEQVRACTEACPDLSAYDRRKAEAAWSLRRRDMQVKETRVPVTARLDPGGPKACRTSPPRSSRTRSEAAGGGEPDGLVNYLVAQAKQNSGPFMTLLGRVLPMQVSGEERGNIIVEIVKPSGPLESNDYLTKYHDRLEWLSENRRNKAT